MILIDDGYRQVARNDALQGDVVLYKLNGAMSHVAEIVEFRLNWLSGQKDFSVLSKWGGDGEYYHDMMDVPPLCGTPSEFYSERRAP